MNFAAIPKTLHVIWIGDDSKCPRDLIDTWRAHHPAWDFKLWGNAEYHGTPWRSKRQMEIFYGSGHWAGVADLMRYEILYRHGGVYVDADSECLRPLDDWLLDTKMFAVWENERHRPGLIANTFIGSVANHPALHAIIKATSGMRRKVWRRSWRNPLRWEEMPVWKSVGPLFFTRKIMPFCPHEVTILPSILFLPQHIDDEQERRSSLVYARHAWHSQQS